MPRPHPLWPTAVATAVVVCLAVLVAAPADAAVAEPSGPHPRIWLDDATLASARNAAKRTGSATARILARCRGLQGSREPNLYMGLGWGANASGCALAYRITGEARHAEAALVYFRALLDDWQTVGDGAGGDDVVRHDSGYAMRAFGPHAALAYDWLHDAPGMTEELRAHARARFAAWTNWYYGKGYRHDSPGTNYHAGYLLAVTLIAIAQGGEAGAAGARLWRHVADTVWGQHMAEALVEDGVLDGGDWGEGWQYGALAVVSYATAARAMIEQGVAVPGAEAWAGSLLARHMHALLPNGKATFIGGDTQEEGPNIAPHAYTLLAVIAGPAPALAQAWAQAELHTLGLEVPAKDFAVYAALAEARAVAPAPAPRATTPTAYLALGTGAFYARTAWTPDAVFSAMLCVRKRRMDHQPPNAGNWVLTRGGDDLLVDPSHYGSLSSLTSNTPTVESAHLPEEYRPSQAFWSEKTRYAWARQTRSGIIVVRCDYADQYRFQHRKSDVPMAMRDLVLLPHDDGAAAIVVDRAETGGAARALHLRFRSLAKLALTDTVARGTRGKSSLTIRRVMATGGTPEIESIPKSSCSARGKQRGNCDAARFAVDEYRLIVPGPAPLAVHLVDAAGAKAQLAAPAVSGSDGAHAIHLRRGDRHATVVVGAPARGPLVYRAPAAARRAHVVLDAGADRITVSARREGADCAVTVTAAQSGGQSGQPAVFVVDETCAVSEDPVPTTPTPTASQPAQTSAPAHPGPGGAAASSPTEPPARGGCGCGTRQSSSPLEAILFLAGVLALHRRG
jgi:hypothetical protein